MNNEEMRNLETALLEMENVFNRVDKQLDEIAEKLGVTEEVSQNPEPEGTPKNIYGIGEVLYLPIIVKGVRENANGKILYEVSTADDKRIGFKIFESVNDIWKDRTGYCASVPESMLVDKFEKGVKA